MPTRYWFCLFVGLVCGVSLTGCSSPPATEDAPAPAPDSVDWLGASASKLTLEYEPVGAIANSGIQPPAVSPDGRHIAYMRLATHRVASPDVLTNAQGVGWLSMYLQSLDNPKSKPRAIANQGACWPAWSPDSRQLLHVLYSPDGRCDLQLQNVNSGVNSGVYSGVRRVVPTPWAHIVSPRFSPSGRFAVCSMREDEQSDWRLGIVDLSAVDEPLVIPPDAGQTFAVAPMWLDEFTILYIASRGAETELRIWSIDQPTTRRIARLNIQTATPEGALLALSSIANPLGPKRRHFVYNDTINHAIAVVDPHGIRLTSLQGDKTTPTVYSGQSLPLHAGGVGQAILFAIPFTQPNKLQLLRVYPRAVQSH
jgi:hypothetical protein